MNTLKNLILSNDDEEMLKEVRAYQNKIISNKEETPIWERKWLTIEEASAYSGIGRGKLRELSKMAGCPFAIWMEAKSIS